ncbi:MAG: VacJ family lipoprotein [Sphingomonas bacterium]|nr:VacJ family lipoprotein [Sphingomonas bacterium]
MRAMATAAALALAAGGTASVAAQEPAAPAVIAAPAGTPAPGVVAGDPPDAAAALAAASADIDAPAPVQKDPLERFNRAMWGFNQGADKVIIKPASRVYRAVIPRPVRRGLSRVLSNLTEPFSFLNGLLQGKPERAFNSLGRFVVNSTIGVAGLADPASRMGMRPTPEDFGQTLAHWGVKSSAYLVLPLLGPSTIRDGVGTGVGFFTDPYRIGLNESGLSGTEVLAINAFQVVSARSDITEAGGDTFLETSLDPYAAARSAYLQRRQAAILDQDAAAVATADGGSPADQAALDAAVKEMQEQSGGAAAGPATEAPTSDATPADTAAPSETTPATDPASTDTAPAAPAAEPTQITPTPAPPAN